MKKPEWQTIAQVKTNPWRGLLVTSWTLAADSNPWPWRPAPPVQRRRVDQLSGRRADRHRAASGHIMSHPPATLPAPPSDGQVCALFAVDIAGFTAPERDDDIRLYLHEELYKLLEKAFDGSGIPWNRCFREDRGDGVLTVIPPGNVCKNIIDPLAERLRGLIRRHNHVFRDAAAIQLRVAAQRPVDHDGHGFIGSDINLLFRMLTPARSNAPFPAPVPNWPEFLHTAVQADTQDCVEDQHSRRTHGRRSRRSSPVGTNPSRS